MLTVFFRACMSFMGAFVAFFVACTVMSYAHAAGPVNFTATYAPNDPKLSGVYMFVEYYSAGRRTPSAPAMRLSHELRQSLNASFRSVKRGGTGKVLAHCAIVLRDWKDGEGDPNFQVRCESLAGGLKSYPYVKMDLPETSVDVMKLVDGLVAEHKLRLARSN